MVGGSARDDRERLPDEVAERSEGFDVLPIVVRLARAMEVLSLANAARERRLLVLL